MCGTSTNFSRESGQATIPVLWRPALDRDVPVVITTRVQWGGVVPEYGDVGGGADLKKLGAVLGGEIDTYKARLLLMLALAQPDFSKARLQSYFIYEEWTR